jgi:hypothetical protein
MMMVVVVVVICDVPASPQSLAVQQAVWVGTRFLCATEAGAPPFHQQAVLKAGCGLLEPLSF